MGNKKSYLRVILKIPPYLEVSILFFRLLDPGSDTEISSYKIHRILFCARGPVESSEKRCFAFTFSHGDKAETAIFQCHVFRCDLPEAVSFNLVMNLLI